MADAIIQVPPDSTGKKIDASSLDVGANSVIRQRIILADNSASANFATVSGGALNVNVVGTVALTAGSANIGSINHISRTVQCAIGTPFTVNNISATVAVSGTVTLGGTATVTGVVFLGAGVQNIGTVNNISGTVQVAITSGGGSGFSMTDASPYTAQAAPFIPVGGVFDNVSPDILPEGDAGAARMTSYRALHVNLRDASGSEFFGTGNALHVRIHNDDGSQVSAGNALATTIRAGTANIGTINDISRTVNVAIGQNLNINGISATVTIATSNPWLVNAPSASHGPRMVQISTSVTATLIAAPGAGLHVYVTSIAISNLGTVNTAAQVGWSGTAALVCMGLASGGGQAVLNFDPPWKVHSNEAVTCRVNPNSGGDCFFNVNFFVAA